jgi:hypothetical protein
VKYYKKSIAPRLANGERRLPNSSGLPPAVKRALKVIAHTEKQSVSWVMEQMVIEYFGIICPTYKITPKVRVLKRHGHIEKPIRLVK